MGFLRDGLGMRVTLESEPDELSLPPKVEQEMYRVLTEGLMNVAQHSQASELRLSLKQTEEELSGLLRDDGIGFDLTAASEGARYGLESMKERTEKLQGRLLIKTAPGKGTEVTFTVPLVYNETLPYSHLV
jgi:two-component system sensor histidine kinase DegS